MREQLDHPAVRAADLPHVTDQSDRSANQILIVGFQNLYQHRRYGVLEERLVVGKPDKRVVRCSVLEIANEPIAALELIGPFLRPLEIIPADMRPIAFPDSVELVG